MPKNIPVSIELGDSTLQENKQSDEQRLKITEIFYSLQGEANTSGWPTVFIRLTGCPLRCQYCDTAYAFTGGTWMTQAEVLAEVAKYKTQYITVTGGEPLAQKNCLPLLSALVEKKYHVSLETSGAISVKDVAKQVIKVLDIKTPDSQESHRNDLDNLKLLNADDQVKFVLCSRGDFDWAVDFIKKHHLADQCTVLFSPSKDQLDAELLAEWILEQQLPVRYQMQLHKILWGDKQGV